MNAQEFFTAAELVTLKKARVNMAMVTVDTSIAYAVACIKGKCAETGDFFNVSTALDVIRSNRETSTLVTKPAHVAFNPTLETVGVQGRLAAEYYIQFINRKEGQTWCNPFAKGKVEQNAPLDLPAFEWEAGPFELSSWSWDYTLTAKKGLKKTTKK